MKKHDTRTINTKLDTSMFGYIEEVANKLKISNHKAVKKMFDSALDSSEVKIWFDDDKLFADLPASYIEACKGEDVLKKCLERGFYKIVYGK